VDGDTEKQTRDRERDSRDDRPRGAKLELRDVTNGKPNPGEEHKQARDFGETHRSVMCETKD